MAEPAKKLPNENEDGQEANLRLVPRNETYDTRGSASSTPLDSRPQLRGIDGGQKGDGVPKGRLRSVGDTSADSGSELESKENEARSGATTALGKEKGLIGSGLNKGDTFMPLSARAGKIARSVFTKKKSATGGILGLIAGGLIFLFSIGQGPLQLVHLSQLLQKNFFGTEQSSSLRMRGLFRYHRTGDIGETRVSKLGSEVFKKTVAKLDTIGIDFSDRNQFSGHLKSVTVDTSKHPAFKELPFQERQAAMIKHFNIENPNIMSQTGQNKFKIDLDATSVKGMNFANSLVGTAVGDLQDGKIVTGSGMRAMKKFYNLPRLFSPMEKRARVAGNKIATKAERRKAESERNEKLKEQSLEKGAGARERLKGNLAGGAGTAVAGALITTEALCLIREVADDVVTVNRTSIVIPSVIGAVDKIAVGDQVRSGANFTVDQPGQVSESFIDENGKTIFGGKALQVLAGKTNPSGEDIDHGYKQAFTNETTAQKLKDGVGSPSALGVDLGAVTCSTPGLIVQGAISVALLAAGPLTAGGSWAAFAAKTSASAAATAGVMYFLKKLAVNLLKSDSVIPALFSGPVGGNLLAYGGREAGNVGARAMGGIAMSRTQIAALEQDQELASRQEFQSRSFADRMFDVYDHRSLAGSFVDNASTSPNQNFAMATSGLANFGLLTSGLFAGLFPKVAAANEPYDWGFPKYGIAKDIIEDPNLENPYINSDKVAAMLNSGGGDYIDRAKKCFGVTISKDSGVWDVSADEEVNPNSEQYAQGNCDDASDGNWKRIILFVFDTRLMTAVACYEDDEEACKKLGFAAENGAEAEEGNADSASAVSSGSAAELLAAKNVSIYAGGQADLKANHINPKVINLLLTLSKTHDHLTVTSMISGHGYLTASGNVSDHGFGGAVDIGEVDGETCNAFVKPKGKCFALANEIAGMSGDLKPSQVIWFVQPSPAPPGLALSDHYNHVHIGYPKAASGPGSINYLAP